MNPDAAFVELAEAKKAVRASRRAFASTVASKFVKAMQHAFGLYREARKQGTSRDEAAVGLEQALRAAWPKAPSRFARDCDACEDTGWVEHFCWHEQRCGRKSCSENPERQHAYVTACHCVKGDRFRPKVFNPEDAIAATARTQRKKRGGFTRMGG
jgi:hypothetical protein